MTKEHPTPHPSQAVALSYAENGSVPKVVASGCGELAQRIIELAKRLNIPIHQDQALTEILSQLDLGMDIPPLAYEAVAEILAFLYRADLDWQRAKLGLKQANRSSRKRREC